MSSFETNPKCHLALPHTFVRFQRVLWPGFLFFFSKAPKLRPIGKVLAPLEITSVASKPWWKALLSVKLAFDSFYKQVLGTKYRFALQDGTWDFSWDAVADKGPHLAMTREARGFSRVAVGFSSYHGDFRLPLVLGQGSPIIHSSCEGELGVALESLQGKRNLIQACV